MQPTQTHSYPGSLAFIQNLAITVLLTGSTVTATAKAVGVSRKTLYRWLKKNPLFIAELRRRQAGLSRAVHDRLRTVALAAMETVKKAIASGDLQASPLALPLQQGDKSVESETLNDIPDRACTGSPRPSAGPRHATLHSPVPRRRRNQDA